VSGSLSVAPRHIWLVSYATASKKGGLSSGGRHDLWVTAHARKIGSDAYSVEGARANQLDAC